MRKAPTIDTLDDLFTYHAPQGSQAARYAEINRAFKEAARVVLLNTPAGPDQERAVMKIVDARMAANMTIDLNEKGQETVKPVHLARITN